jgi:hypothetical protein
MHGVPANLDLRPFHGDTLTQLCLGQYQVQFHFSWANCIFVEGGWALRDACGALLCHVSDRSDTSAYAERGARLYVLLGTTVTGSSLDAPISFTLFFDNGMALTILDDSDSHESFSVGGIFA